MMKIRPMFLFLAVFAGTLLLMRFVLWSARRGSESTIATEPTASQTVPMPASVPADYDRAPSLGSLGLSCRQNNSPARLAMLIAQ